MATNITHIKKITIGTPVRKVTGASVQSINDLIDVTADSNADGNLLVFKASTGKFTSIGQVDNVIIAGGGAASADSAGGDF
jgi:hypothetical protein